MRLTLLLLVVEWNWIYVYNYSNIESIDAWASCIGEVIRQNAAIVKGQLNIYAESNSATALNFRRDMLDRLLPPLMENGLFSVSLVPYARTVDFNQRNLVLIIVDSVRQFINHLPQLVKKNVEFRGYFLLIFEPVGNRVMRDEVAELLRQLWAVRINNVLLAIENSRGIDLLGYVPYGPQCCSCSRPILLNRCLNGQLQEGHVALYDRFERNLYGCQLRIACFERAPFMQFVGKNGVPSSRLAGIEGSLVELLAERLKFRVQVIQPRDGRVWGHIYANGTADGALGLLLDGAVHLTIGGYFPYPLLLSNTTQSHSYYITDLVLAVPEALATLGPFKRLLKPFRWTIWALLLFELAIGLIALLPSYVLDFWRAFVGDSLPVLPHRFATRFMLLLWIFHSTLLRESYKGSLVSFLTEPTPLNDISSLKVLLADGYRLAMTETVYHKVFDGTHQLTDPDRLLLIEPEDGLALLERTIRTRDRLALAYTREEIIKFNERNRTIINYRTSDEKLLTFHFAMYFKRSSPVAAAFGWYIRRILSTGFIARWQYDNLDMRFQRPTLSTNSRAEVLNIHHLLGSFLLLFTGLWLSIVVFTLEFVWVRYLRQRRLSPIQYYPYFLELPLYPTHRGRRLQAR